MCWYTRTGPIIRAVVRVTSYWIVRVRAGDIPLRAPTGEIIAMVDRRSYAELLCEGTGRLPDGRVVNIADKSGRYWSVYRTGYGFGVGGRALIPWRSCATDPARIPLDSIVWWRGHALRACDVGPAIKGWHIDVFVGDAVCPISSFEEVTVQMA